MDNKDSLNFFKTCTCGYVWKDRDSFLSDPCVEIIGYHVDFVDLLDGLFLFIHHKTGCMTTIAIKTLIFRDLYNGPVFEERKTGKEGCPGYCLVQENLIPCPAKCICAYVREIVQLIKNWKKKQPA